MTDRDARMSAREDSGHPGSVEEEPRWPTPDIALGEHVKPGPLGIDDPWPWQARHPAAPATRYEGSELPTARVRSTFGTARREASRRSPKSAFARRLGKELKGAAGIPDQEPEAPFEAKPAKKGGAGAVIRDCLSPSGVAQIKAMMHDPSLALTVPIRDLMGKLGRYGQIGDKEGLRRTVAELADKLNVGAAPHGTVLVEQALAGQLQGTPAAVSSATADSGKRTIEHTQGGRTLRALAPILAENGTLTWKDGLAHGWQRLSERFALQAEGTVDVVVGRTSTPPTVAPSKPPPVGQWGTSGGGAPIGQWTAAGQAESQKEGPAPIGSWSGPAPGSANPVGEWSTPPAGAAGSPSAAVGTWDASPAAGSSPVGRWTVPSSETGASQPPVGGWAAPARPDPENARAPVGQWSSGPPNDPKGDSPPGQWTTPTSAADSGTVGQWLPTGKPSETARPAAADGSQAAVGSWSVSSPQSIGSVKISDRMTVADVVRKNPNISALRILEYNPQPDARGGFREVLNIATSALRKHFGD